MLSPLPPPSSVASVGGRAETTRESIAAAAEALFREIGYRKTTVADIARRLRMSPANVYRFFPSKAAINEAITTRLLDALDERVWAMARGPGTPAERIAALFGLMQRETMMLFFDTKRMHDMVAVAMDENWPAIDTHIARVDAALRHVVEDGQASGDFAPLDPAVTARLLHATTMLFTHPTLVEQKCRAEDLPAIAEHMAAFVLRALRP